MAQGVNSAELSLISGEAKNVVAQFIGQEGPDKSGNYRLYWNNGRIKMRAIKNIRLKDYDYSSDGSYFITICTNYRRPYLTGENREIVAQSIEKLPYKVDGVKLDYYQIMPSHVHLILILEDCELKLAEILRRLKAITTKRVRFKLWQPNYYEHVIRSEKALASIRGYIKNNPLEERIL